jgi:D-tyrosyl-tRNA(Tyr) deacylase
LRIVLQRVKQASVSINGALHSRINSGMLILLAIHKDDDSAQADILADKCANLRIFADPDDQRKMNRSLIDTGGKALVVSQFTLYGDCRKGRRPSFTDAAGPEKGKELYEYFVQKMRSVCPRDARDARVETGVFGAMMDVELVNDGPVTFVLDA